MSIEENVKAVKNFFAAMGSGDKSGLLALSAEDIEWIIPGEDWPLAGTHRGSRLPSMACRRLLAAARTDRAIADRGSSPIS